MPQKQLETGKKLEYIEISHERKIGEYFHTLKDGSRAREDGTIHRFKVWHDRTNEWAQFVIYVGQNHATIVDYWQSNFNRNGQIRALGSWQAMDAAMRQLVRLVGPGEFEIKREHYNVNPDRAIRSYSF